MIALHFILYFSHYTIDGEQHGKNFLAKLVTGDGATTRNAAKKVMKVLYR